jgi:hypothetical protein
LDSGLAATTYLKDGWVRLSGAITGGSTQTLLFTVHPDHKPTYTKRLPVAFTFNLPDNVNEHAFLQINTLGEATLVWTGQTPNDSVGGTTFLDGLSYRL